MLTELDPYFLHKLSRPKEKKNCLFHVFEGINQSFTVQAGKKLSRNFGSVPSKTQFLLFNFLN